MAEEAILRVKLEEGPGGPTVAGAGRPAGRASAGAGGQPERRREDTAGHAPHDALFTILRRVLGAGLFGSLSQLLQSLMGLRRGGGAAAATARAATLTPRAPAMSVPRSLHAEQVLMRSLRTGIQTQQVFLQAARVAMTAAAMSVRSQQTAINAPGASVRITGVRMQQPPAAGAAPRSPRTPGAPPGGGGRGGGGFPFGSAPPRYPPPAARGGGPLVPAGGPVGPANRFPPPGPRGRPVFTYPAQETLEPARPRVQARVIPPAGGARTPRAGQAAAGAEGAMGALGNMSSLIGAASGVGAIVAAVVAVVQGLGRTLGAAVDAAGAFTQGLTNASTDLTQPISQLGNGMQSLGEKGMMFGSGLGVALFVAGKAVDNFSKTMENVNRMAERYAAFSGQLAVAQARGEVANVLGDIRRAQETSPALTRFVEDRTKLTQQVEDLKAQFLNRIVPYISDILEILSAAMPEKDTVENLFNIGESLIGASGVGGIFLAVKGIAQVLRAWKEEQEEEASPTDMILNNPNPFDLFRGNMPDRNRR